MTAPAWGDMEDMIPVNGWLATRCTVINDDGVGPFVAVMLVGQTDGELMRFAMSVDVAGRLGIDLCAAALGIDDPDEEAP